MILVDLALSRRLERAEGLACRGFAEARREVEHHSKAAWHEEAGVIAVFDDVDSPVTQTFGLGVFEPSTPELMDVLEDFFFERGADAMHEVSPLAGVATLALLTERGYRPIEISAVMVQRLAGLTVKPPANARLIEPGEVDLWAHTSARAWAHDHPEFEGFMLGFGKILAHRSNSRCFLAEIDGQAGAAGSSAHAEGIALFSGAATIPEFRRRGLQAALLAARLADAASQGCEFALMVAEAGSQSQRNAQRNGFQIAYTRTKWRKGCP